MNVEAGIQIDLVGAARRRAPVMGATAVLVFLVGYWIAMVLPSEYTSYATMLVEPPSVSRQLVESGVAGRDLNTRLNLMTAQILSRPRLSRLIDELDLYQEESEEMTRDAVIAMMRQHISVVPVEGALVAAGRKKEGADINTFQIYFTDDNQRLPSRVAQALAQNFIDEHIGERVEITQKSFDFVQTEEQRLAEQLRTLQSRIGEVKQANLGSLPEDLSSSQRQLMSVAMELRDTRSELDQAESESSFWGKRIVAVGISSGDATLSPEKRVRLLELELAGHRSKGYTDKHPDVIDTLLEIQTVQAQIESAQNDSEGAEAELTFEQLTAQAEQERALLRARAATEKIARLSQELETIQSRVDASPQVSEMLDALERQWRQVSISLADFENRRVQASVQANLERRQLGEQFRILEPAFVPLKASAPNRLLILAIGAFLGVVAGLGLGVGLEALDSTVHKAGEAQDALAVPVLAVIPAIRFHVDAARSRQRRFRYALMSSVFVVFNLLGGAFGYLYMNGLPGWARALVVEAEETPVPVPESESESDGAPASPEAFRVPIETGSKESVG